MLVRDLHRRFAAMMALAFERECITADADALILEGRGKLVKAAREVARLVPNNGFTVR